MQAFVTAEDFVVAWTYSRSLDEVRERLKKKFGVEVRMDTLQKRAAKYRRLGVQLKRFPRSTT